MALKSTIYKAELQVADLDRGYFGEHALTLAKHPSETDERLMLRLLAFALFASPDLSFGKGISNDDEAALWEVDAGGVIRCWIEVGQPEEERIRKACSRSEKVVVINYGARAADVWWLQQADKLARYDKLSVWRLPAEEGASLAALAGRNMHFSCTIQESVIYFDGLELHPIRLK